MENVGKVRVTLEIDDKDGVKIKEFGRLVGDTGAAAKKEFTGAAEGADKFDKATGRVKSRVGGVKAALGALGAVAVFQKLTQGIGATIKAASDLQETTGKFDVVFKGHEAQAAKMSKTLVDSYAMSTEESKRYLASMQDLMVPMGMASDKAATMSGEVVKLSADLGSFNNLPTEKVMDDIQSALVGNYETMKKYGVVLNAAVVEQKAVNMGLADNVDDLNAAQKAQAAYKLMVEGSTSAIGDMGRTSGSFANQQKQFKALMTETAAILGENFLPIITRIITAVNNWLKANQDWLKNDLKGYIEKTAIVVGTLAKGVGTVIGVVVDFGREAVAAFNAVSGAVGAVVDKVKAIAGKPIKLLMKFMGKGSSEKPLSEKFTEMEAKLKAFQDKTKAADPVLTLKMTGYTAGLEKGKTAAGAWKDNWATVNAEIQASHEETGEKYKEVLASQTEATTSAVTTIKDNWAKGLKTIKSDVNKYEDNWSKTNKTITKTTTTTSKGAETSWGKFKKTLGSTDSGIIGGILKAWKSGDTGKKTSTESAKKTVTSLWETFAKKMGKDHKAGSTIIGGMFKAWEQMEKGKKISSETASKQISSIAGNLAKGQYDAAIGDVVALAGAWIGLGGAEVGTEGSASWKTRVAKILVFAAAVAANIVASKKAANKLKKARGGWIDQHPGGGVIRQGGGVTDDVYLGSTPGYNHYGMGGEYVVNKEGTARFLPIIDWINNWGRKKQGHATGGTLAPIKKDWKPTAEKLAFGGMTTFFESWGRSKNIYQAVVDSVIYHLAHIASTFLAKTGYKKIIKKAEGGPVLGFQDEHHGFGKWLKRNWGYFTNPMKTAADRLSETWGAKWPNYILDPFGTLSEKVFDKPIKDSIMDFLTTGFKQFYRVYAKDILDPKIKHPLQAKDGLKKAKEFLMDNLSGIPTRNWWAQGGLPGGLRRYQYGGIATPGTLAWVGERGPELAYFGAGGRVLDSNRSLATANAYNTQAGGSIGPVKITIPITVLTSDGQEKQAETVEVVLDEILTRSEMGQVVVDARGVN